jgi:threonine dehydratase
MSISLQDIQAAAKRIHGAVYRSPCTYSLTLSRLLDAKVYCKLDHLQMTGSFKERGARNKLLLMPEDAKKAGVIAASAGNHAQALAYHGQLLGISVTVVMPKWAPLVKVGNCRTLGANVILHGESFADARAHAMAMAQEKNLTYVHGFDDPDIIAGAGTMALEILEDVPNPDAIFIPIGGGGLIAGCATAIKAISPRTKVIGVEPRNAPTYYASVKAGKVTRIDVQPTLADGLAIAEIGSLCFEIARHVVDEVVLVEEGQLARAVLRLLEMEKTVVEGAGASSLAAAMEKKSDFAGKTIVLCLCGGNIDVSQINRVIERGLAADGRICKLICQISDRPGGLAKFTQVIATTGASVKEVSHDRNFGPADVSRVAVHCVLETRDAAHVREVIETLKSAGIPASDASQVK